MSRKVHVGVGGGVVMYMCWIYKKKLHNLLEEECCYNLNLKKLHFIIFKLKIIMRSPSPSTLFTLLIMAIVFGFGLAFVFSESCPERPSTRKLVASSESGSGSLKASKCIQPPKCLNCISPAVQQKMAQCTTNQAVRLLEKKKRESKKAACHIFCSLFLFLFLFTN